MAFIVDKQIIFDDIRRKGITAYDVKDYNTGELIHSVEEAERLNEEQVIERLDNFINSCTGNIKVWLKDYNGSGSYVKKSGENVGQKVALVLKYDLQLSRHYFDQPKTQTITGSSVPDTRMFNEILEAKIQGIQEKHKADLERMMFEQRIKDLQAEKALHPVFDKLLNHVDQILPAIINIIFKPTTPINISGMNEKSVNEDDIVIQESVGKLKVLDVNFSVNIKNLAELAEKNLTVYKMAVAQLSDLINSQYQTATDTE